MYGLKTPARALFVANGAKKLIPLPKVHEPRASEPRANLTRSEIREKQQIRPCIYGLLIPSTLYYQALKSSKKLRAREFSSKFRVETVERTIES
jgi:hypothetical protein